MKVNIFIGSAIFGAFCVAFFSKIDLPLAIVGLAGVLVVLASSYRAMSMHGYTLACTLMVIEQSLLSVLAYTSPDVGDVAASAGTILATCGTLFVILRTNVKVVPTPAEWEARLDERASAVEDKIEVEQQKPGS